MTVKAVAGYMDSVALILFLSQGLVIYVSIEVLYFLLLYCCKESVCVWHTI